MGQDREGWGREKRGGKNTVISQKLSQTFGVDRIITQIQAVKTAVEASPPGQLQLSFIIIIIIFPFSQP